MDSKRSHLGEDPKLYGLLSLCTGGLVKPVIQSTDSFIGWKNLTETPKGHRLYLNIGTAHSPSSHGLRHNPAIRFQNLRKQGKRSQTCVSALRVAYEWGS